MKRQQTYTVDWYRNGFCYRTTIGVPRSELKDYKKRARNMGDEIQITEE